MLLFKNAFIKRREKTSCSGADGVGDERYEWRVGAMDGWGYGWRVGNMDGQTIWIGWGYGIPFEMGVGKKEGGLKMKGTIYFINHGIEIDQ